MDLIMQFVPFIIFMAIIISVFVVLIKKYKIDKTTLILNYVFLGLFLLWSLLNSTSAGDIFKSILLTAVCFFVFYDILFGLKCLILAIKSLSSNKIK